MATAAARTFEDLIVWKKAHALVLAVYRETINFPKSEIYGLTAQLRRAVVSIAANIAEGFKRRSQPEKARFMNVAQGSLEETRYYLILARDLGWLRPTEMMEQLEEVSRLLEAYTRALLAPAS